MRKKEALKAALDGKRLRKKGWGGFFKWDEQEGIFIGYDSRGKRCLSWEMKDITDDDTFEIVPETVDFFAAWKAYEEGRTIRCGDYVWKKGDDLYRTSFSASEIRGQWIILDGDL